MKPDKQRRVNKYDFIVNDCFVYHFYTFTNDIC